MSVLCYKLKWPSTSVKVKIFKSPQIDLCHRSALPLWAALPFFSLNFNHCQAPCCVMAFATALPVPGSLTSHACLDSFLISFWKCRPTKSSLASLCKIIAAPSAIYILSSLFFLPSTLHLALCSLSVSMNCALFTAVSPTTSAWPVTASQCEWILHFSELS